MFPEAKPRGTLKSRKKLFTAGPVIKCFVTPNSRTEKKLQKKLCLTPAGHKFAAVLRSTTGVESSSCSFRELVSFDPRHVTRSPPIGKCI